MTIDVASVINFCISMLSNPGLDTHLETQKNFIKDTKFDEILIVDQSLNDNLNALIKKYNGSWTGGFEPNVTPNNSPKELDAQALQYIQNTSNVKQALDQFYANDFLLLSNPNSLLKATT